MLNKLFVSKAADYFRIIKRENHAYQNFQNSLYKTLTKAIVFQSSLHQTLLVQCSLSFASSNDGFTNLRKKNTINKKIPYTLTAFKYKNTGLLFAFFVCLFVMSFPIFFLKRYIYSQRVPSLKTCPRGFPRPSANRS